MIYSIISEYQHSSDTTYSNNCSPIPVVSKVTLYAAQNELCTLTSYARRRPSFGRSFKCRSLEFVWIVKCRTSNDAYNALKTELVHYRPDIGDSGACTSKTIISGTEIWIIVVLSALRSGNDESFRNENYRIDSADVRELVNNFFDYVTSRSWGMFLIGGRLVSNETILRRNSGRRVSGMYVISGKCNSTIWYLNCMRWNR